MPDNCCTADENIMILPCSGGSNVGQLSNQAAVELTREGFGKMFCLAGIGGGLSGFVQSAKDVDKMIVIDGCDIACGKTTLEKTGVLLKKHIVVSELDIHKDKSLNVSPEDVAAVKHAVKLAFKYPIKVSFDSPQPLSPEDRVRSRMFGKKCC